MTVSFASAGDEYEGIMQEIEKQSSIIIKRQL